MVVSTRTCLGVRSCTYASKQAGITTKAKGVLERDKERKEACIIAAYARSAPIYQVRERRDRTRLQASTCSCPTPLLAVRCRVGCSTAFCKSAYRATVQFSERAIVKHLPDGKPSPAPTLHPSLPPRRPAPPGLTLPHSHRCSRRPRQPAYAADLSPMAGQAP